MSHHPDARNKKYYCNYCTNEFKQKVRMTETDSKHSRVSSQVVCPECGNFLSTWD